MSRRLTRAAAARLRRLGQAGGWRSRLALRVLFAVAPRFARPRALRRTKGTVEWRIGHEDGTASIHTMTFAGGRCRTSRTPSAEPDLTLQLPDADFFALALDGAEPVGLVVAGRLRVAGDLELAFRLGRVFRGPRRRS